VASRRHLAKHALPAASPHRFILGLPATPAATARRSAMFVTEDGLSRKNAIKGRGQLQQLLQVQPFFTMLCHRVPKSQSGSCSSAFEAQLSCKAEKTLQKLRIHEKRAVPWVLLLGQGSPGCYFHEPIISLEPVEGSRICQQSCFLLAHRQFMLSQGHSP